MKFLCRLCAPALLAALLVLPTQATAAVPHTVQAGETLWSIAAASNFTTRTLAAANGLPEDAQVVVGTTIQIPSEAEGAAALATRGRTGGNDGRHTSTGAGGLHGPAGGHAVGDRRGQRGLGWPGRVDEWA